ncbi:MAG: VOC family protein [Candidatus Saccharicenans sp.]|jgi:methylmalonyl-CoA epimerase|nr:VOC family protein [Candidatus Saccharicenans sp.]MDH7574756.1 VOC family protein [Candidatus Saccharicenans sp.]
MKAIRLVIIILAIFAAGVVWGRISKGAPTGPLGTDQVVQVGIVVKDIEKASRAYAEILGLDVPQWFLTDTVDKAHTEFRGKPSEARAKLAFLQLKNITIELIEPVGGPSTWREFLDQHGEGVHHLAFEVKGMDEKLKLLAGRGIPLIQKGDYEGGRYAYVDGTGNLAIILELLENF